MTDPSTDPGHTRDQAPESRHAARYWRARLRLEYLRLALWSALQIVWETLRCG
ncbi:hypothetical protein [Actinomadura terrae]|uniref:hypothetical protein n=1 Tax=Actinomadura terrae TaxID=604353 RepID=UPI001FA7B763|nr:hypothetical protein [Actinomadura terrae]